MKKLFIFYLGGRAKGSNIELHDIFFGIGENPQDCYPLIKKHWFGEQKGLHVDCYAQIEYVDGFDITIEKKTKDIFQNVQSLFFLNLGAYEENVFGEKHYFKMVVAKDKQEAKSKAKALVTDVIDMLHTDNVVDIDDILIPSDLIPNEFSITLTPSENVKPIHYTHGYFLID